MFVERQGTEGHEDKSTSTKDRSPSHNGILTNIANILHFTLKVTGGNRGIGYAVVKRLSKEFNGVVLFTGNSELKFTSISFLYLPSVRR